MNATTTEPTTIDLTSGDDHVSSNATLANPNTPITLTTETGPTSAIAIATETADALRSACSRVAPVWPLERFVAVNPYFGMTDRPFGTVAELLASTTGARTTMPTAFYLDAVDQGRIGVDDLQPALAACDPLGGIGVADFLARARADRNDVGDGAARVPTVSRVATECTNRDVTHLMTERVAAWAAAYFDEGQATWRSADAGQTPFAAWKAEASIDRTPEIMGLAGFRVAVRSLPDDAIAAADLVLGELGVRDSARELYLHTLLLQVGGWSAHAARIVWDDSLYGRENDTMVEFLAVLLGWEFAILCSLGDQGVAAAWQDSKEALAALGPLPAVRPTLETQLVFQDAFDRSEQRRIIEKLAINQPAVPQSRRPSAQTVFCIDVRSEVFRRHLETVTADIDTIGFAGFFGFAIEYLPLAHETGEAQYPVLLTPAYTVEETVPDPARHGEVVEGRRLAHHVERAWKSFKMGAISCFSFVGPVGLAYLPKMFTDAYGLSRPVKRAEDEGLPDWAVASKGPTLEPVEATAAHLGIPLESRIAAAQGALGAMSMTSGFAPIVMITGHGAATVNNPYHTGLDCGACGGHTGEANARVAVAIFNDPDVRAGLVERGIEIPADTWFVAAQHNTTTDEISIFDRFAVPASHAGALADLEKQLAEAGRRARAERSLRLGLSATRTANGGEIDTEVLRRSTDWAQVRPEWGLAGCRAFVVAPRNRTQGVDFGGRSFLHSYDWRQDSTFAVLELIMTAPMVVASWISLQYYASTVENRVFGSGNKVLHNVVGRIGVLEGNAGDLRVGLPWQSVHDGDDLQHDPLRLNVIIEAPIDAMNAVLAKHDMVRDLCDNGWLHLLAMDDTGSVTHRYVGGLRWDPVD